ncbi:MAG: class I SAM-dependent rRNA methyltransferase [Acidobacteria bacterium]|nr:class I SAM-dependent rRNA methyltransferase [Acidobacteriota bacterium]
MELVVRVILEQHYRQASRVCYHSAREERCVTEPNAKITSKGFGRLDSGHLWVYRSDVAQVDAGPGDVVRVVDHHGRFVGRAFYSDRSQITLRFLTREDRPADASFFRQRLETASKHRKLVVTDTECFRLVHGEGDLLPSVVVDRYGDYFVLQTLSQGAEKQKELFVNLLVEMFSPHGILERNDPRVRQREGLPQTVQVLHGDVPPKVTAGINGLQWELDLHHGQKTGAFLDQRENYRAAARYAHGQALDCFTYAGGFGLTLAGHCSAVESVDLSEEALQAARRNQELNHVTNISFRAANVFDLLKQYDEAGRRFDTIVLDPPAFAKDRASIPAALRGYKEINLRSLKLLNPGGCLVTCSCSHHVAEHLFLQMLAEAANDTGRLVQILERKTQASDHPILLTVPETMYIKCFILKAL